MSYSKSDGSVRIRHREYIADIVSPGTQFTVSSWPINPGIGSTFNWLQMIANSYEMYTFNNLAFEFESSAVTTDRGTLLIAIDFDASDIPPISKQEMMTYSGAVRSSVWSHCSCIAPAKDLKKFGVQKFVRSSGIPPNTDVKTYDVGNLYVATQGTGVITVGELYVSYDVTFSIPQSSIRNILYGYSAKALATVGVTAAKPFGDSVLVTGGLGVKYRNNTSLHILTLGSYMIEITLTGSGFDATDAVTATVFGGNFLVEPIEVGVGGLVASVIVLADVTQSGAFLQLVTVDCVPVTTTVRFAPYSYVLG